MPGTSFDRVADVYDATRGGQRRGDRFAEALASRIVGPLVVECGVGTGVIAGGLRRHGVDVVGFDLSAPMMRAAVDRIGSRVAVADADRLPLADGSVDTVFFVWVLQLVPDPLATLAEAARVVRHGGRVITILSNGEFAPDDEIAPIFAGLDALRADRLDREAIERADIAGLTRSEHAWTPWDEFPGSVTEQIAGIENRIYSSMFDVDDATWAEVVVPVIDRLRALPEPDRPRIRRNRHPIVVWERTAP